MNLRECVDVEMIQEILNQENRNIRLKILSVKHGIINNLVYFILKKNSVRILINIK